jgi:RNA polymerase sigma-70 factor (ECF subfamily)
MRDDSADAELVSRLRNGEPEALAAVYDRYSPAVYSLFLRITRHQTAAEDLLQELFLRIWLRARDFDVARGSLGVWILSIARNMAIDYTRSSQSRLASRWRPVEQADQLCAGKDLGRSGSLLDEVQTIREAFSHLNFNQKRVLELAYFEGCSQSEIAARLNEPLGTVKSWIKSALARLRTAISGDGGDDAR